MLSKKSVGQLFTLCLIVLLGTLIVREMTPYLTGILGALTFYVLLKKYKDRFISKGLNKYLVVSTLLLFSFLIITVPIIGTIILLSQKIENIITDSQNFAQIIKDQVALIEGYIGINLSSKMNIDKFMDWLSDNADSILGSSFDNVISLGLMYFLLYFMLINQNTFRETIYKYLPLKNENLALMGKEIYEMIKSNALGIPLVAIAQGAVALIGFLIFNISNPFFWAIMVTVGSMIPFVGNMLGTLPAFIVTLSNGRDFEAWGILLYGIVVVGLTDNLIRLVILKKLDNVHPLITLIGVLVGLPLFGFLGLIFGPLLVSLFLLIVSIYRKEYKIRNGPKSIPS